MNPLLGFIRHTANWWIKFIFGPIFEAFGFRAPETSGGVGSFIAQSDALNTNNICAGVLVAGGLFFGVEVVAALCLGHVGLVGGGGPGARYCFFATDAYRKTEPAAFWILVSVYGGIGLFSFIAGIELFRGHLFYSL